MSPAQLLDIPVGAVIRVYFTARDGKTTWREERIKSKTGGRPEIQSVDLEGGEFLKMDDSQSKLVIVHPHLDYTESVVTQIERV